MTPAVGSPGSQNAEGLAFFDSRVKSHPRPPPRTVPPIVVPRKARVFVTLVLFTTNGLPAAAPASAPSPAPRSMRSIRDGETCTQRARAPAPTRPTAVPYPAPVYGVSDVLPRYTSSVIPPRKRPSAAP